MDRTAEDSGAEHSYLVYEFERRAYPLSAGRLTIGRDAASDIVVREPSVSRSHAELTAESGEVLLRSSGATGTLLNGVPVTAPAKLIDGDTIVVGSLEFTFRRGRLPLGVSIVDALSANGHDPDAMTKRDTIKTPILAGSAAHVAKKGSGSRVLWLLLVLLAAAATWYFLGANL